MVPVPPPIMSDQVLDENIIQGRINESEDYFIVLETGVMLLVVWKMKEKRNATRQRYRLLRLFVLYCA